MKIDIFNAEEKYDILYTDPPWQQGRGGKKAARPNSTGTTVPYETMDVPGIMELSSSQTRTSVEHSPRYSEKTANGITARSRNVPIRC